MATKAYLLIETAVGKTRDVANTLSDLPGIATRRYYVLPDSRDCALSILILYKKDGFKASVLNKREESNDRRARIQSCDGGDRPPR